MSLLSASMHSESVTPTNLWITRIEKQVPLLDAYYGASVMPQTYNGMHIYISDCMRPCGIMRWTCVPNIL